MNFIKKNGIFLFYIIVIAIVVALVLGSMNQGSKFFLTENEADLYMNSTYQIEIEKTDEESKDKNDYKYICKNEDIASVDENGLVSPKKSGKAEIEVKNGVYSETIIINVKTSDIELNSDTMSVKVGETFDIHSLIKNPSEDEEYKFRCKDSIVKIDGFGMVTALSKGTTVIYISNEKGDEVNVKITVTDKVIEADSIELDKVNITIKVGETTTVKAIVTPENAINKNVTWSSNNECASVDANGNITGVKKGTAIVTAKTVNGFEASLTVTVEEKSSGGSVIPIPTPTPKPTPDPVPTASISLDRNELTLKIKGTYRLIATVKGTKGSVTWTSSDTSVASVNSNGVVTAKKEGTTLIKVSVNDIYASCVVKVVNDTVNETSISLNKSNIELIAGESSSISVTFHPSNTTDKSVTWSSSNASVANYKDGLIYGYKEGKCTITATSRNGKKASVNVAVKKETVVPTIRIDVSETKVSIPVGEKKNVTATVYPSNATSTTLTWSSSNPQVATVSNGLITGVKEGNCIVTVKNNAGTKADISVTVTANNVKPTKVTLNKTSATLASTKKITLTATVEPSNADNKAITWSTSDKSIATVENGVVTAKKEGSAKINAKTYNGKKATFSITVRSLKVLLVGNSKTYRNPDSYASVYNVFVDMMSKAGYSVSTIRSVVGGSSLIEHAKGKCIDSCETTDTSKNNSLKNAKEKLTSRKNDIAILQEKTGNTYSGTNYEQGVKEVVSIIKGKNSDTEIYLRQNWYHQSAYKRGDMSYQERANKNCGVIAKNKGLKVINDGLAFMTYYNKYKDLKLFLDDTHGTDDGVYLAVLCMYKGVTGNKASSVTYRGKVTSARATLLKAIADDVCK